MAFDFNAASTDAMGYGDIAALDTPSNLSVCLRVDFDSVATNRIIVSKRNVAGTAGWELLLAGAAPNLRFSFSNAASTHAATATTTAITTGKHVVGFSYNGTSDTVQFMLNGADESNIAITNATMANSASALTLGNRPAASVAIDGRLNHVMIWDVALTLDELKAYHAGVVPRPASLKFWQPCWSKTMKDLVGGAAPTETGTVGVTDDVAVQTTTIPRRFFAKGTVSITALLKIINETLELTEGKIDLLGLLKILNETLELPEGTLSLAGLLQVVNETLGIQDGDNNDVFDPAGKLTETMNDGTVWTGIFPPFTRRTRWTS